eukprot:1252965-Rhodomonas_salina.1
MRCPTRLLCGDWLLLGARCMSDHRIRYATCNTTSFAMQRAVLPDVLRDVRFSGKGNSSKPEGLVEMIQVPRDLGHTGRDLGHTGRDLGHT